MSDDTGSWPTEVIDTAAKVRSLSDLARDITRILKEKHGLRTFIVSGMRAGEPVFMLDVPRGPRQYQFYVQTTEPDATAQAAHIISVINAAQHQWR
jgi:hypothetical protein